MANQSSSVARRPTSRPSRPFPVRALVVGGVFIQTPSWRAAVGTLLPPIEYTQLPSSLLERFTGSPNERLLALLRYLAPISSDTAGW